MITSAQRQSFYRAALLGLRVLEAREDRGRRFSSAANARWGRFCGALHAGDRVQTLLRDASVPWGIAFSGAQVFGLDGVAQDEPFGARWQPPSARQGEALLAFDASATPTLAEVAAASDIAAEALDMPPLGPGTTLTVTGGAAILAAAEAFAGRRDLDWARQVRVVADAPHERQFAGLASLMIEAVRPCAVHSSSAPLPDADSAVAAILVSNDAAPACAARVRGA